MFGRTVSMDPWFQAHNVTANLMSVDDEQEEELTPKERRLRTVGLFLGALVGTLLPLTMLVVAVKA